MGKSFTFRELEVIWVNMKNNNTKDIPPTSEIIENFTYVLDHLQDSKDPHTAKMKQLTKDLLFLFITGEKR